MKLMLSAMTLTALVMLTGCESQDVQKIKQEMSTISAPACKVETINITNNMAYAYTDKRSGGGYVYYVDTSSIIKTDDYVTFHFYKFGEFKPNKQNYEQGRVTVDVNAPDGILSMHYNEAGIVNCDGTKGTAFPLSMKVEETQDSEPGIYAAYQLVMSKAQK